MKYYQRLEVRRLRNNEESDIIRFNFGDENNNWIGIVFHPIKVVTSEAIKGNMLSPIQIGGKIGYIYIRIG